MSTLRRALSVLAATLLLATALPAADAPPTDVRPPELKVLDRWIGDWDMDVTVKATEDLPQGAKSTFKSSIRWAVNERFLRRAAEGEGTAGDRKYKDAFAWVCTWDPDAKTYFSTVFWANVTPGTPGYWGGGDRGTGTWDESAKTLTIRTTYPDGTSSTSTTRWLNPDHHEFTSTFTDPTGKLLRVMSGTAKRRK